MICSCWYIPKSNPKQGQTLSSLCAFQVTGGRELFSFLFLCPRTRRDGSPCRRRQLMNSRFAVCRLNQLGYGTSWLRDKDLNLERSVQSRPCCHYTIPGYGSLCGDRTRVFALKGRRPDRLDEEVLLGPPSKRASMGKRKKEAVYMQLSRLLRKPRARSL